LKNWEMKSQRMHFLEKSVENIKENRQISISIKTILRIFENFPTMGTNLEDTSKNMVLNKLQDKYRLFELVLEQFKGFKQDIKAKV